MRDYTDIVNKAKSKKKEEETGISSSSRNSYDATSVVEKAKLGKRINLDTLESDLSSLGTTIGSVYSGWQTQETMLNTRKAVESMHKRLTDYQSYQSKYGGNDMSEVLSGYQSVLDDWDNLSTVYGNFQNADAFNTASKKWKMDEQFKGLTYDDVQKQLKQYGADSDEYSYLSNYTGYTDLNDFEKALSTADKNSKYYSDLTTEKNKWELDHTYDKYKQYTQAEDFAEKSQYQNTAKRDGILAKLGFDGSDETYEYINDVDGARDEIVAKYKEGNGATEIEQHGYQYMTDEEKAMYNYLYNTDKKLADQYLKDMEISLNKRVYDKSTETWEKWSEESALKSIGMDLATPVLNLAGGVGSAVETVKEVVTGREYNPYAPGRMVGNAATDMRKYVGDNIEESTNGAVRFLHDTAFSMADSGLRTAALGKLGTVVAGLGAYQQTAKELTEAGASDAQVQIVAAISGAAEVYFEHMGIDNLFKIKNVDSLKNGIKSALKQAGTEGLEELGTEITNILADTLFRGDTSELISKYHDMIERGYSVKEANTAIASQIGKQIGMAALGGALSGAGMGSIYGGIQYNRYSNTGKTIKDNYTVDDLAGLASELDGYQEYIDLINSGKATNAQIGSLYEQVDSETTSTFETESGKAVMRTVANMANEMGDSKNSGIIASAFQKMIDKQKLSAEEKAVLKSDTAKAIAAELKKSGLPNLNVTDSLLDAKDKVKRTYNIYNTSKADEAAIKQRAAELTKGEETMVGGETANVDGIRVEDGVTTVLTDRGEVLAEDADLSAYDAEIVASAENMSPEMANLFVSQYEKGTDVESYRNAFNLAYTYGQSQMGLTFATDNIKNLSTDKISEIYKAGRQAKISERQKAIDAIKSKYVAKKFYKGTVDDSVIDYTNSGKGEVNWDELTEGQRESIEVNKALYAGLGINVKFSTKGIAKNYNGYYDPKENVVVLDVYAGVRKYNIKDADLAIISTSSHELTHWMEKKSPELYAKLQDHVFETLRMSDGVSDAERIAKEIADSKGKLSRSEAISEIVARACEDMLSMSEMGKEALSRLTESERKTIFTKVKEIIQDMIDYINEILGKYKSKSDEAIALREYQDRLKEQLKLWESAMKEAVEVNQSLIEADASVGKMVGENFVSDNAVQLSVRTYENVGRELLHNWLANSDLDDATKKEIIEQMDYVYDVATKYAEDNELIDFGSWSETDVIRRNDGTPILTVVVPNGDYPMNIDFSQICKKRKALNSVLNALVRSGDLNLRTLTQSDIGNINRIIKEHGFEIACALCFVDSKRYRVNEWADSFTDTYNNLVKSLVKGTDLKIDEFNFTGRDIVQPEGRLLKDADDSELNFDHINDVLAKNSAGKAVYRYANAIKQNKHLRSILNSSEIISSAGLDPLKVQNEELYALVNSHQGTAKPKLSHGENPYGYEILLDEKFNAKDAYKVGGVRIQSFSDYMANMFFDYVQMIGDLSAKQLPAHAYTKEYYFAKLFGLTGIKINLSIVPKGADITDEQKARFNKMTKAAKEKDAEFRRLKAHAGLDANGNYILEDETFPLDKALELQNTEGYDKNCGIIWVGVSDKHIEKMLDDDNIPFIIPYHKSSLNPAIARMRNIDFYNDYTNDQNTRYNSQAKKKVPSSVWSFDFYGDLAKTNDPKQTAENYKRECAERGYLPKFDKFADHPNYYKLLVDFRVYDKAGNYAPQSAVQMAFPDDFEKVVGESLTEAQTTKNELDADMSSLLDEVRRELKIGQKQYSRRDSEGNELTPEQQEFFKDSKVRDENGNLVAVYHGTPTGGFTEFEVPYYLSTLTSAQGAGYYFTDKKNASQYMKAVNGKMSGKKQLYKVYLNIKHPMEITSTSSGKISDDDFRKIVSLGNYEWGMKHLDVEKELRQNKFDHDRLCSLVKVFRGEAILTAMKDVLGYDGVRFTDQYGDIWVAWSKNQIKDVTNTNPTDNPDIRYAERTADSRTLLTNALDTVAQTDQEKELLAEYRKNIDLINIKESELAEIRKQIKELSFASGPRDMKKLDYLKNRAEKIRNSIAWYDKKLLNLEATEHLKAVVDREKAKIRKRLKEDTKQELAAQKERIEKRARIESITQKSLVLNKWMMNNSKDEHIPEAMKPVVIQLLKAIDFSSKQYLGSNVPTQKDISLAKALSKVKDMITDGTVDGDVLYELYGADMDGKMKELVDSIADYVIEDGDNAYVLNRMTLEQLETLDKVVSSIKAAVSKMNRFHVAHTKKSISNVAQQGIVYLNGLGKAKLAKTKLGKGVSHMLKWGNATPYYAFKRFGEGGELVYESLMDGWDKFSFNIKKVIDKANEIYDEEQVKNWSEEVKSFEILLPATKEQLADPNFKGNHQEIQLTTAQIMSLYCLQKREQAKGHILGGGIRIADIETKKEAISQSEGVVITESELDKIISSLDAEQIRVADALQEFMNKDCAEWGNEISMKRFGYKAFGEQNYFPIRSDENVTGDDTPKENEKSLYRLLNMSFTKALTQNANNRIVVENIFDVFAQHTSEMAKYNALALPVLDAVRWFNYKEKGEKIDGHFKTIGIRQSMESAFGKDANNFVSTFLKDINGAENVGRDRIAKGFMSNAKIASVGFNAKVVALQPTSYLRASAVIDNKYLIAGLGRKPKSALAEEHCGMALWKSLGFIDINVQRGVAELIKHDKSTKDKWTETAMKGAGIADRITIGYLWNACEAEIKDKRTDLKVGTDEYYEAVGKRLREIIYATQVVDSTMTRSHMMRSGDTMDKVLTNFASEPTLSYNMLMDAYYSYKLTERQTGNKKEAFNKHGKKLARTMYAYTITAVITSVLEAGFDVFRDDEEKDAEDLLKIYLENLYNNMSVLSKIPYAKEVISALQGFASSRIDTQWMQYFAYSIKGIANLMSGSGNAYTTTKNLLKAVSYATGVPGYNIWRDANALLDKLGIISIEELEEMFNDTIGDMFPSLKSK